MIQMFYFLNCEKNIIDCDVIKPETATLLVSTPEFVLDELLRNFWQRGVWEGLGAEEGRWKVPAACSFYLIFIYNASTILRYGTGEGTHDRKWSPIECAVQVKNTNMR